MNAATDPGPPAPSTLCGQDAVTTDRLFGGDIVLRQFRSGHRVGTDAVLLASLVEPVAGTVIDVGAGVGAVGIAIARRNPQARVILVDNDPAAASLARDNLALNALEERGTVAQVDVLDAASRREAGLRGDSAMLAVTNPPYYAAGRVRASPDAGRRHAHLMAQGAPGLAGWIAACVGLLAPKGRFAMIHRADALAQVLRALEGRAGDVHVTPVSPGVARDATRILVQAVKGGRGRLAIRPTLVLHDDEGRFTPQVQALHGRIGTAST